MCSEPVTERSLTPTLGPLELERWPRAFSLPVRPYQPRPHSRVRRPSRLTICSETRRLARRNEPTEDDAEETGGRGSKKTYQFTELRIMDGRPAKWVVTGRDSQRTASSCCVTAIVSAAIKGPWRRLSAEERREARDSEWAAASFCRDESTQIHRPQNVGDGTIGS